MSHGGAAGTPAATRRSTTASPAPIVALAPVAQPEVSVVIVTYRTGRVVVDAIATADRAAAAAGVAAEVVVVDNLHPTDPDRSRRHLRLDTTGVHLVEPGRNLGFGGGCELGILHARAPTICLLNPDVSGDGGWLGPLLDTVADPAVTIAAPILVDPDGGIQEAGQRVLPTGWTAPRTRPPSGDTAFDVDFSSAACWVIRRDEHERIGGFDPDFHPAYFEDADLAFRARRLGGRTVVHPASRLTHIGGAGTLASDTTTDPTPQHAAFVARWPIVRTR